jgi:hypothetical protein
MPDNKYGLASSKVATEHHEAHHKDAPLHPTQCKFCNSAHLTLSPSMQDYHCDDCGEWQSTIPQGYSTGRATDY